MKQKVPTKLKKLQKWFGDIITQPLTEVDGLQLKRTDGDLTEGEVSKFIKGTLQLQPMKRLEIYNQQYWWRLINFLQLNYPCTVKIVGSRPFRVMATNYLIEYPPNHWSMTEIGKQFPEWISKNNSDRLIICSAELDLIFYSASIAAKSFPLNSNSFLDKNPEVVMHAKLYLQPHVTLAKYDCSLIEFRESILTSDHIGWKNNVMSDLNYYVIFRNNTNVISWKKINNFEYALLAELKKGKSLAQLTAYLVEQNLKNDSKAISDLFQNWIWHEWLTLD